MDAWEKSLHQTSENERTFCSKIQQLELSNIQFGGENVQLSVSRFVSLIGNFPNLAHLTIKDINEAPYLFQAFSQLGKLPFTRTLKELHLNACEMKPAQSYWQEES